MTRDVKLANVLVCVDGHAVDHPELYYRGADGAARYDAGREALEVRSAVDFTTYLNGFSAGKWHRYAGVERVVLRAAVCGAGELAVRAVACGADSARTVEVRTVDAPAASPRAVEVEVPCADEDFVGFELRPAEGSSLWLHEAAWYAAADPARMNPVRIALVTTTFQKEAYITANMELVKRALRTEGLPVLGGFHMFVVDNGRTLDAAALSDDMVTVIPNANTGGSGGCARGMLAATADPDAFTHVIVMDDDVRILPESLIRTHALLSLAQGVYRQAFLNGAMLSLEEPSRQVEDVSYVAESGVYRRAKGDLDVSKLRDVLVSERTSVEVPRAYGAWWYSCIPVSAIVANGLPMPFFIRCDDVEFGIRNDPVYMTMAGICVWHESFEGRFRASVDCYQYVRNFMAMIAMDDCASEDMFVARLQRTIRQDLRDLDYSAAELLLDGFEDYLKGPDCLASLDGAARLAGLGARNEHLVAVSEMDRAVVEAAGVTPEVLSRRGSAPRTGGLLMKLLRTLPYDKHYLPGFLLDRRPGYVVKFGPATIEGSSVRREALVVLDPTRTKGAVRHMDRARFRAIRQRQRTLMRRWRSERKEVRRAWRAARDRFASRAFWEDYLGLR
ncbi:glycosyltransferase [Collinsella tanakaei]|uniref:glycosyltransferase n=1 Tax=Collinsella tanakaei TaxID=626935 RepID=UPI0025A4B761|nr:glycosyltransferase [Collinsella tanakaei]MDM8301043.1 glycosyltransferase [Collinsella tanakaei]